MSRIRWTSEAVDQIEDVVKHIQRDNPDAAACKVTQGIYAAVTKLEVFPSLGRVGEKEGIRELVHTTSSSTVSKKMLPKFSISGTERKIGASSRW